MRVAIPLLFLLGLPSLSAVPGTRQAQDELAAYRKVVDEYRDGGSAPPANVVSLTAEVSIVDRAIAADGEWTADALAAAAMLHTDVALRLVKTGSRSLASPHLDAAAALLRAAVARAPEREEFLQRWRNTIPELLHAFGSPEMAGALRTQSSNWLPEPLPERVAARAAFEAGVTSEIQAAIVGRLSGAPVRRAPVVPPQALWELKDAARYFELALTKDPDHVEAALHLGRVRVVENRPADAERWLRVASRTRTRRVRYLAELFLGVAAERQARYDDAERLYRAAIDTFRWGQSAPLALSHLMMRTGREREAEDVIAAHFQSTRGRTLEPMRTYLAMPDTEPGATLDQLRAEVWR